MLFDVDSDGGGDDDVVLLVRVHPLTHYILHSPLFVLSGPSFLPPPPWESSMPVIPPRP